MKVQLERREIIIGTVTHSIFNEDGKFQKGSHHLSLWPFYKFDPRLGCMKEYHGSSTEKHFKLRQSSQDEDNLFCKMGITFEKFIAPMYWSPRDFESLQQRGYSITQDDKDDKILLTETPSNKDLAELKKLLIKDPLQEYSEMEKRILFICREHYCSIANQQGGGSSQGGIKIRRTLPHSLPIFLKSVNWSHPVQVHEVYRMLQVSEPMDPEEAICLLDAKYIYIYIYIYRYADEAVRLYAVERVSEMSDDNLALYMLQFSQALLYETHHFCPLAELLLERSLKNPYVVGLAFFWTLKSNLHIKMSYERYSILLEQFMMLSGNFKEELEIQLCVFCLKYRLVSSI